MDDPEEIASNLAVTPVSSRGEHCGSIVECGLQLTLFRPVNMNDEGDVPPYGGHEFDDDHDG